MDPAPGIPGRNNASHKEKNRAQADGPGPLKIRVLAWTVLVLAPLACYFGVTIAMVQMQDLLAQNRDELDELLLADAQAHAARMGIRWDEERELAKAAAIADYNGIPIGLFWQFRRWENGSKLYAWGQVVRAGSVRALFMPSDQQVAQAARTIAQAWHWFALINAEKIRASLEKRGIKGRATMAQILGDRELRKDFVTFVVEKIWRARARRKDQIRFILGAWEKWDTERGKP